MDRFVEMGGNLFDTANIYGQWTDGTNQSEQVVGKWLACRDQPDDVLIATKGGHPRLDDLTRPRLDHASLLQDLDQSRAALGRDLIDLYFLHRDDLSQPVEKLLEPMESFRSAGLIRWYGISNWRADRLRQAIEWSRQQGDCGLAMLQNRWSLARFNSEASPDPTMAAVDQDVFEILNRYDFPVMAYGSMGQGFYSKLLHCRKGTFEPPEIDRVSKPMRVQYENEINLKRAQVICEIAHRKERKPSQIVLAWLLHQQILTFPVVGFSSLRQLEEAMVVPLIGITRQEFECISAGEFF